MLKLTKYEYIKRCQEIHGNKYDYSLVEYCGMDKKIKIICPVHGIFEQNARNHVNGCDCKCCINNNIKSTRELFIKKAEVIHNNKYNYKIVNYINCETKIKIICPEHGIFEQRPTRHLNGDGCSKCAGNFSSVENFIKLANSKYNNKYDYSLINYMNNKTKVKIICPEHGIFEQRPDNHLMNKQGCPICASNITKNKNSGDTNSFIKKANIIHNNKYEYSLVDYINNKIKIKIICSKHGIFEQSPNVHLNNRGCPICSISKGEEKICIILDKKNINYDRQKKFEDCKDINNLPFDFYLKEYNICIEFDGIQHFKSIEYWGGEKNLEYIKKHDEIKNKYCNDNNIKLIRIRYNHKNLENIISNYIN